MPTSGSNTELDMLIFEREKVCYEKNHEHVRGLNEHLNRVPITSITLTGGLWYIASLKYDSDFISFIMMMFASISNLLLILIAIRIRDVLQCYLEELARFNPNHPIEGRPKKPILGGLGSYSMIAIYCTLMLIASLISAFGAFKVYCPSQLSAFSMFWFAGFYILIILSILAMIKVVDFIKTKLSSRSSNPNNGGL